MAEKAGVATLSHLRMMAATDPVGTAHRLAEAEARAEAAEKRVEQLVAMVRVLEDVIEFMRDTAHDDERAERGTFALHYIHNALKGEQAT